MAPKRDIAAARLRRQGIDPDLVPIMDTLLADRVCTVEVIVVHITH